MENSKKIGPGPAEHAQRVLTKNVIAKERMKPILDDWDEAYLRIWIGKDESIHYDSQFEKSWPGSFELLMSCVEDNIYDDESIDCESTDCESIDWGNVQDEYLKEERDEEQIEKIRKGNKTT